MFVLLFAIVYIRITSALFPGQLAPRHHVTAERTGERQLEREHSLETVASSNHSVTSSTTSPSLDDDVSPSNPSSPDTQGDNIDSRVCVDGVTTPRVDAMDAHLTNNPHQLFGQSAKNYLSLYASYYASRCSSSLYSNMYFAPALPDCYPKMLTSQDRTSFDRVTTSSHDVSLKRKLSRDDVISAVTKRPRLSE